MVDSIKNVLNNAKEGWKALELKKKIIMITAILSIILIAGIMAYNLNKVDYSTLFTNLELQDAGIIVNDLETKGIKYKLSNDGKNIAIDSKLVDEYRLQLAMDGMMPQSSTGFEIFDNTGMMVTDEDRQIMYQRALTGELQRSIMSLEAVNSAKVHLVMPEKSIFETEAKAASASVVIDLKPSQKVTEEMIRGIVALISGAVDNMPMENIQVIDSKGNLLSAFMNEGETLNTLNIVSQYQQVRKNFESEIEANLNKLLGSAFGYDKINVSVLADLDFDGEETTTITYFDPILRSEQIEASGGNIEIQQVTGGSIDDNISNVIEANDGGDSSFSRTTNNEVSSETKNTIKSPGKINKLTTSVLYKGELSDVNRLKIQNLVAAATGYDGDRGDIISIEDIQLAGDIGQGDDTDVVQEGGEGTMAEDNVYITYGLRGLAGLAIVILIILTIRNRKRNKEDRLFQEQLAGATTSVEDLVPSVEDYNLDINPDTKGQKAQSYAKENPEIAADLIKAWMKD